jgi:hypothetical protein
MLKKIFKIIIYFHLFGCNLISSPQTSDFYVATICQSQSQKQCIKIGQNLINSVPILILNIEQAQITPNNRVNIKLTSQSKTEFEKMQKDYLSQQLLFFSQQDLLDQKIFHKITDQNLNFELNSELQHLFCQRINCIKSEIINKPVSIPNDDFPKLMESYQWSTKKEEVKLYPNKDTDEHILVDLSVYTLRQTYLHDKDIFLYYKNRLKFIQGYIDRADLVPHHPHQKLSANLEQLKHTLYQINCHTNKKNDDPMIIELMAIKRSLTMAIKVQTSESTQKLKEVEALARSMNCN